MQQKILIMLSGCMLFLGLEAQDNCLNEILRQVESTEIGSYYLPLGSHNLGNYSEVKLSQSFKFPTVYQAGKELIGQQEIKLQTHFLFLGSNILITQLSKIK